MDESENESRLRYFVVSNNLPAFVVARRGLSTDNTINIIFGMLASIIGFLSLLVAWTTWRLMRRKPTLDFKEG
jgi:hypothetical protein